MPGLYLHIYDTGKHILERWERESKNMRKRTEIAHKIFSLQISSQHHIQIC